MDRAREELRLGQDAPQVAPPEHRGQHRRVEVEIRIVPDQRTHAREEVLAVKKRAHAGMGRDDRAPLVQRETKPLWITILQTDDVRGMFGPCVHHQDNP